MKIFSIVFVFCLVLFSVLSCMASTPKSNQTIKVSSSVDKVKKQVSIQETISQNRPYLKIGINGNLSEKMRVNSQGDTSLILQNTLLALSSCDNVLRYLVSDHRLEQLRSSSFVQIDFSEPIDTYIATGNQISAKSIITSIEGTSSAWDFYYLDATTHAWHAVSWTQPELALSDRLRSLAHQVIEAN